jgi:signal transduction histidine kinase
VTGDHSELSFVVVAPIGRDGDLICVQLRRAGLHAECWQASTEAIRHARDYVAGVIVTDEALDNQSVELWRQHIERQPAWSDLPFIVLTSSTGDQRFHATLVKIRELLGNVTILDRPVRVEMLLSAADACLRARRRQYEIRDHIERRRAANDALRESEKLAVAGRLAASIAHEINNPLEGIMNLIYLIAGSDNIEQVRKFADLADAELQRVSEIVNQTLRFHRMPTIPAPTELGSLINSALALFKARFREKEIRLVQDVDDVSAFCSAGEIRQALVNLVGNALDAMPPRGTLTVRARRATHAKNGESGVRISVADTGTGIAEDVRGKLFQQFFTTKGSVGTGLGLWLTKEIVDRNRGTIRYHTRVKAPSGTVFSIWLPCEPLAENEVFWSREEQESRARDVVHLQKVV